MDIETLKEEVRHFCEERDWRQFHNPKDLAIALNIEASELLEIFLWKNQEETQLTSSEKREQIEHEIADIAIYLIDLIDVLDMDLESIIRRKLELNRRKYPVSRSKGKNLKYNELD